ncbi:auxin transport protein BIG [Tanacetum coccineum]
MLQEDVSTIPVKKDGLNGKERPKDIGMSWLVKTQYISPLSTDAARQVFGIAFFKRASKSGKEHRKQKELQEARKVTNGDAIQNSMWRRTVKIMSRGLCAPHDVGKGEMLFMVPKSALMTSHSLMKNEDKMQTGISIIEGLGNHHQNEPSCGPSQYAEEATSVYGTFLDEPKQVYTMVIERLSMQIENEYKFVDKEYRGAGHSYITWAANPGRAQGSRRLKTNCEFILEQLCNLIYLSEPKVVYHLILKKAHTQEEFIRGLMTKNLYSSGEIGPLMRDVKNKIYNQLDLLGLIEDDCGDLSIAQVYEQVWKKSSNQSTNAVAATLLSSNVATSARDSPPMTVTYRLQGLDGEATERMIKELDEDREEGPRSRSGVCYRKCSSGMYQAGNSFGDCLGILLNCIVMMIVNVQHLRDDLKSNQEQLVAVLNLLMLCCKIRENRRALLRLGALSLLLEIARRAFSIDAIELAEGILLIVESLTMEANESDNINIAYNALTVSNEEAGAREQAKKIVLIRPQKVKQTAEKHRDDSMKTSSCGERLKDIILENGITEVVVRHLKDSFVFTGEAGFKLSLEWHSGLKLPSVPLILSMLRGLSMGHLETQKCIDKGGILSLLHQATSYTSEAVYKTCSSKKAEPLGCSSLDSLYLNCSNLSELNLNSCKALLPVLQSSKLESVHAVGCPDVVVSNDPVPSEDNYSHKRMADGSKRVGIPFSFSQPSLDDGKGTFRKRRNYYKFWGKIWEFGFLGGRQRLEAKNCQGVVKGGAWLGKSELPRDGKNFTKEGVEIGGSVLE